ncbi:DUF3253 domain-containing protein [Sagittula sp. SSi028]|uniref:DUF3253 domain-containing protein n=1 Tax=Sagittula sp. SSi028 TaxID=3400636 RepID=UPI003AF89346
MSNPSDTEITAALMRLAGARAPKTFCPSEVARALSDDWRPLMPRVRVLSTSLSLVATQKGRPVDAAAAHGPIRLSLKSDAS